jgi:FixJ family two-component response regulator
MSKENVYIIDDDLVILTLYTMLLESSNYNIHTYNCAHKFLKEYDDSIPPCAIIDVNMPDIDGLKLFKEMKLRGILIPVIFMSGDRDSDYVSGLFREGAFDFFEKPYMYQDLILSRIDIAMDHDKRESIKRHELSYCKNLIVRLTDRERHVLKLLAVGNSAKVIAKELNISYRTVEAHITNIKTKTQLNTLKIIGKYIYLQIYLPPNIFT